MMAMPRLGGALVSAVGIAFVVGYLHLEAAGLPGGEGPAARQTEQPAAASIVPTVATQRAYLDRYCVRCHNDRLQTAGLMLDRMDLAQVGTEAETWEKVVRKVRGGAMPPANAPQPDTTASAALATWLETRLDQSAVGDRHPRRPVVHRLNRVQYTNAVRDLLALDIDGVALLPADEIGYGFDNIADVLSVTSGLLGRYLLAAQKVSRLAIGDPTMRPVHTRHEVSNFLVQTDRVSDDLPFLSRGGTVIRQHFPLDGEYVLKVRLRRAFDGGVIKGIDTREQLDVRLDGTRLTLFNIGGECVDSDEPHCVKSMSSFVLPSSEYDRTADTALTLRFQAKAGPRVLGISFLKSNRVTEGAGPDRLPQMSTATAQVGEMGVASVDLEGPFNPTGPGDTPSRQRIFVCQPTTPASEEPCARQILTTLAHRAYRGMDTDADVQTLLRFYQTGRSNGDFGAGIQFALEKLLVSPKFLLRVEGASPPATAQNASLGNASVKIDDTALASRLSFFLWGSIPDDELLEEAAAGRLRDPGILERQVLRMLADPRAVSLVSDFASQWLYLRDLQEVQPDPRVFPDFDESLREAFTRETTLFLESQVQEDRPLVELLTANYTFVNERLARFYGIPHVYGNRFRRVELTDPNRAGLLGHASLLTVTSYSTRTSPVVRGKYLLSNILGSPPPPPPPDVEALEEPDVSQLRPTMRARMEAHRANPVCAACHAPMDPLGFALENFNAIGKWRTTEAGSPIDSTGSFPDGTTFSGPAEFREVLLGRRAEFIQTFTEKMLTYALGRGVEYYDMPAVRSIIREAAGSDHRWSSLILGIVRSAPFQASGAPQHDTTLLEAG